MTVEDQGVGVPLTCPHCLTLLAQPAAACPHCGAALAPAAPPAPLVPPTPAVSGHAPLILPYGELQHAATYLGIARSLRGVGIGQIVYGVIQLLVALFFAIQFFSFGAAVSTVGPLLLIVAGLLASVIGVGFIAGGIWLITAPSARAMLMAAVGMFVSAGLFLLHGRVGLLIVILVVYGITLLKRYKKYGTIMEQRPTDIMLAQAGELLDTLRKAKRGKAPELIEFSTGDAFARRLWRGLLRDNLLVFVVLEARMIGYSIADVLFLPPAGLEIDVHRRAALSRWLKATFYVNDQKIKGTIPPECYERFLAWKQHPATGMPHAPTAPASVASPAERPRVV